MASMIATLETRERSRVRVFEVDAECNSRLAARLGVTRVPSLVLVRGRRVLGRIEGRASASDVSRLLDAGLAS
jgi:thioredoxin-like negative regulator of GroEL